MTTIILIVVTVLALGISAFKDKTKTIKAVKGARGMMKNMASDIIAILLLIGLILTLIPPAKIQTFIGNSSGILTTIGAAIIGSITLIPAFVAFPLAGSLMDSGAGIVTLTAFITTLTMVGFVTFPLESSTFGKKFAIKRNVLSLVFAILIALGVGVIL